ncbi:hypothetical protein BN2497_13139 [Janthinobacterium sp. CG23_2]|nr:hypothetical protein BN2497_13139 [Janthinobacterium sp. CG23_2]CUU32967.1 hypothetical protein BN3177_13139 [Janthinobacterium sp. CG23_2]
MAGFWRFQSPATFSAKASFSAKIPLAGVAGLPYPRSAPCAVLPRDAHVRPALGEKTTMSDG